MVLLSEGREGETREPSKNDYILPTFISNLYVQLCDSNAFTFLSLEEIMLYYKS
jgi:hypothetical protein